MFGKKKKTEKVTKEIKLGLALGGGGARGFAHIGALDAFMQAGIRFDMVAGTSAGAFAGAAYCAGMSIQDIMKIVDDMEEKDIRPGLSFVPRDMAAVEAYIEQKLGRLEFSMLKTPLYVVAVDLISARQVVISEGSVARAVCASCAIPGIFKPVIHNGRHLVDGGLLNTIPTDVLMARGAAKTVAVDVNSTRGNGTSSLRTLDVLAASVRIMGTMAAAAGKISCDVLISLDLQKYSAHRKEGYREMIEIGRAAARERLDAIRCLRHLPVPASVSTKA